jgi:hypothetical protein
MRLCSFGETGRIDAHDDAGYDTQI